MIQILMTYSSEQLKNKILNVLNRIESHWTIELIERLESIQRPWLSSEQSTTSTFTAQLIGCPLPVIDWQVPSWEELLERAGSIGSDQGRVRGTKEYAAVIDTRLLTAHIMAPPSSPSPQRPARLQWLGLIQSPHRTPPRPTSPRQQPTGQSRAPQRSSHAGTNSITHLNGKSKPAQCDGAPQASLFTGPVWPAPGAAVDRRADLIAPIRAASSRARRSSGERTSSVIAGWRGGRAASIARFRPTGSWWGMTGRHHTVMTPEWTPTHTNGGMHKCRHLVLLLEKWGCAYWIVHTEFSVVKKRKVGRVTTLLSLISKTMSNFQHFFFLKISHIFFFN